ncbi:hypothetical protein ABTJ45_19885, partial [Acinetobacter baumannii]
GLARKHRVQPDDLAELTETLTARLARIEGGEDTIQRLEAALAKAEAAYTQAAETLSAARTAAAARLDSAVATELAPLKLDAARFRTVVDPLP